jgi:membrane associated rhomboid family serine protease
MIPIGDDIPTKSKPIITILFIIINIAVFGYEISLGKEGFLEFAKTYGFLPKDLLDPIHYWKFITYMFIHANLAHLLGNLMFLWVFGNNVEDALGKIKYILFYFASGIGAAILQASISLMFGNTEIPMIGASGAISGILAAYVKLYPEARIITIIPPFFFFPFVLPAYFFVGYWFFIQVLFAIVTPPTVGGVAWYAHIGGFLTGWYLINTLYRPKDVKLVHYSKYRVKGNI